MSSKARRALAWSSATILLISGCGARHFAAHDIEARIKQSVAQQNSNVVISQIRCPDKVEVRGGATFTCTATGANGKTVPITVRQTDDKGHVVFSGNLGVLLSR